MGWAHCGINPKTGAEMGYGVLATCDQPGCRAGIDHGLDYVCGGMHEGGTLGCGKYFCEHHRYLAVDETGDTVMLCEACLSTLERESAGDTETGGDA